MDNIIELCLLNPVKLYVQDLVLNPPYKFVHFDEGNFASQIPSYKQKKTYYQKWEFTDPPVQLQFTSNFAPVQFRLIDCKGSIVKAGDVNVISTNYYSLPTIPYLATMDFEGLTEGIYWFQLLVGVGGSLTTLISEPQYVAESHADTMLTQYSHSENEYGAVFTNGERFGIRMETTIRDLQPSSNDVVFEDEIANIVVLSSSPFRVFKMVIGNALGVPEWVIDTFNRLYGCDNVTHDNKQFTKNEGSKFEPNRDTMIAMGGWQIDIRESKARRSSVIVNNNPLNKDVAVIYDIETIAFADLNNPPLNSTAQIIINE